MNTKIIAMCIGVCALGVYGAEFVKAPAQAVEVLKAEQNKEAVRKGFVFLNGKFIPGPYRVARYGNVLKVNGKQVTSQIVSWNKFLIAQGVIEAPKAVAPKPAAAATAKSVDDLFDDDDAPAPAPAATSSSSSSVEAANVEISSLTPSAQKLKDRVNAARMSMQKILMNGDLIICGTEYSRQVVPAALANKFICALPDAVREANSGAELARSLAAKGFPFVNRTFCEELIKSQAENYEKLQQAARRIKDDEETARILGGGVL